MKRDNTGTQRYLMDAGIGPGMHVLELGCGGGEVTEVLADLVGPSGTVVALERNEKMLAMAEQRMEKLGSKHAQFVFADATGDLSALESFPDGSFHALVGRRVLMYLSDPVDVLRRLSRWLRNDGVVVFEEADSTMVPARTTPMVAHDQAAGWLRSMLVAEGANPAMGFALPATFAEAGLQFKGIRANAVIEGQPGQFPLSALVKMMGPRILSSGTATQAEVDALVGQMEEEALDPTKVYVWTMSFCAWATKP
ncbi:MAG: methyltransferase domain-containing protein [Deltaproteobacteria bacterium]|nr:MAG: methyltransferase domain-containing protein [Deltaproteobacteria bacterium]